MAERHLDDARREGLGRAIKVLRVERGMSRSELADAAGISYSHLAEIENGNKEPSAARFSDLAEALDLTRTELVSLQEAYTQGEQPVAEEIARPERPRSGRGRSFVVPLMGGEWEAMPGQPEPARAHSGRARDRAARLGSAHPAQLGEAERRELLGELVIALQSLSAQDIRRLVGLARDLSARR